MFNWHQMKARKHAYRLRNYSAHIRAENYIQTGKALCGQYEPKVYVLPEDARHPANNTCKKCLAKISSIGE